MEPDDQRIRAFLEEQLQEATRRRDAASTDFETIARDIPSGLPPPDGAQRIKNASDEYAVALRAVTRAVKRISEFQIHQIVPEDLK